MGLCWELYEGYIRFRVKGLGFTFWGVPMRRTIICWGLYCGPPI